MQDQAIQIKVQQIDEDGQTAAEQRPFSIRTMSNAGEMSVKQSEKQSQNRKTGQQQADAEKIIKTYEEERLDIMSLMKWKKLKRIKMDFIRNEEETNSKGLTKREFVKVMLQYLPDYQDPAVLTQNLIQLFKQIDVNDDGTLEWEQFSNHLIELGMVRKDRAFLDAIKNYRASDIKDTQKHDTQIQHLYFLEKLKHLLVMERDSKKFKVYSTKTGKFLYQAPGNSGAVIGADYIPEKNLVATSANNNSISLWEPGNVYMFHSSISTNDIQMVVKWDKSTNRLYSGGCDHIIHSYDIDQMKQDKSKESPPGKGHTQQIMDILPIASQNYLVSCGMDKTICLWSLKDLELKKQLTGPNFGIYSLAWSPQQNCLISAGLDHDIYIWNLFVDTRTFLLKGHNHSLVGVKCLPGTHQIVSADISGMFRIWDDRTLTTIQAFNCSLNEINCFTLSTPPKRIIAGGKRLVFYDYDEPTDQHLSDEQAPISVLYNSVFYTFITAHSKCIKIWDATTGQLSSVFRDLTSHQITSICMDSRERKLFVGDSKGKVIAINIKNGAKMKKFTKHKADTSAFCYWPKEKRLISASWDGVVRIHDDTDPSQGPLRFKFKFHKSSCNAVSFNASQEVVASASDDKTVVIANLNTYRQQATLSKHKNEVKTVLFLQPYDALVSSDLSGHIYFWAVAPSRRKNTLLLTIKDDIQSEVGNLQNYPVRALAFDEKRQYLYSGDEMGHVHKWDISRLLFKLQKLSRGGPPSKKLRLYTKKKSSLAGVSDNSPYRSLSIKKEEKQFSAVDETGSVIINQNQPGDAIIPAGLVSTMIKQGLEQDEEEDEDLLQYEEQMRTKETGVYQAQNTGGAFITGIHGFDDRKDRDRQEQELMNVTFNNTDVHLVKRWKAHTDGINQVCFVEDPLCLATCSFDCNVKIWSIQGEMLGSLVLGKGPKWQLKINKQDRIKSERDQAFQIYEEIKNISYKEMIANKVNTIKKKQKQQTSNPLLKALNQADQEEEKSQKFHQVGSQSQIGIGEESQQDEDDDLILPRDSIQQLETLQQMQLANAQIMGLKPKASTVLKAKYNAMLSQAKRANKQQQIIQNEKNRRETIKLKKKQELEAKLQRQRQLELKRQEMLKEEESGAEERGKIESRGGAGTSQNMSRVITPYRTEAMSPSEMLSDDRR